MDNKEIALQLTIKAIENGGVIAPHKSNNAAIDSQSSTKYATLIGEVYNEILKSISKDN